jgi:hypothetical protein
MDLEVQTITTGDTDRRWAIDEVALTQMKVIQLDGSHFTGVFTNGVIPSGTPLSLITATGLYGLYDNATAGGEAVFAGFLGMDAQVINKAGATHDVGAQLYDHGLVLESALPTYWGTTLDGTARSAAKTDNAFIQYR